MDEIWEKKKKRGADFYADVVCGSQKLYGFDIFCNS
jgi:hypothetical protein